MTDERDDTPTYLIKELTDALELTERERDEARDELAELRELARAVVDTTPPRGGPMSLFVEALAALAAALEAP